MLLYVNSFQIIATVQFDVFILQVGIYFVFSAAAECSGRSSNLRYVVHRLYRSGNAFVVPVGGGAIGIYAAGISLLYKLRNSKVYFGGRYRYFFLQAAGQAIVAG